MYVKSDTFIFISLTTNNMTAFEHCLTPEDFTTLLNLLPIISRRGGFSIKEYADITPLYEKMAATAKANPDLFAFEEGSEEEVKDEEEESELEKHKEEDQKEVEELEEGEQQEQTQEEVVEEEEQEQEEVVEEEEQEQEGVVEEEEQKQEEVVEEEEEAEREEFGFNSDSECGEGCEQRAGVADDPPRSHLEAELEAVKVELKQLRELLGGR